MPYAPMTTLPDAPSRSTDTAQEFSTKADAHVASLTTFVDEININGVFFDETGVKADAAVVAHDSMLSNLNFKGNWADQTGAAAIPYAVFHNSRYWQLLAGLADVTLSEPGITSDWALSVTSPDSFAGSSSTGTDSYVVTLPRDPGAYVAGERFQFIADVPNVGACSVNRNGAGIKTIKLQGGAAPHSNAIVASIVDVEYDGTDFILMNPAFFPQGKGQDVSSASALTLATSGDYFDVTGTATIASISSIGVGAVIKLHFDSPLQLTHSAFDLVLPGGENIAIGAGDEVEFVEYDTGDWRLTAYTPYVPILKSKVIDIGDWNMDSVSFVSPTHGLSLAGIRSASVFVRNDAGAELTQIDRDSSYGSFSVNATTVVINRVASGPFDSFNYDSTSYNRGWITIWYIS